MGDYCIYDRFDQCFHDCERSCCPQATRRSVTCTRCGCDMVAGAADKVELEVCEEGYAERTNEEE